MVRLKIRQTAGVLFIVIAELRQFAVLWALLIKAITIGVLFTKLLLLIDNHLFFYQSDNLKREKILHQRATFKESYFLSSSFFCTVDKYV